MNNNRNLTDRLKRATINDAICVPKTSSALPASLDYRTYNWVTPVKNQRSCGSCWAFAATATIESQWAKKTGKLIDLSEQDLVNCVSGSNCNGGSSVEAFTYVKNNGQSNEASAPYTAQVLYLIFI